MKKRLLGKTGFEVSIIGFGGIPIQRKDKDISIQVLKTAKERGINFIDTARVYGSSEELIGLGLEVTGRDGWIIATKSVSKDYEGMKNDIDISLKNLKTDVLDLYQLHNVRTKEQYDQVMGENGALEALKEAKEEGKIREIGITSHDLNILKMAVETGEFSTIQFPYNPVERQGEELFKRAKELNIGVIIMKPVAGGAIRNVELSLRFIAENENISVIIPGMDSSEHVIENSQIGIDYRKLTDSERDIIHNEAKELGEEFCRRCGYCLPCPEGIDIPVQFLMEAYYSRYDLKDWSVERYGALKKKAHNCVECGACEPRCPYDLPIRKMLKKVTETFGKA